MKIIGITGPIGSGKSYVSSLFAKRGFACIDTDEIYHGLVSKKTYCTEQIQEHFGDGVILPNGSLDRKALGNIVFHDRDKLNVLNKIAHACVEAETKKLLSELEAAGTKAVIVEVPLMFESGFDKMCDTVICVTSETEIRIERIMARNALTREEAELRIENQKSAEFYIENSDHTVVNNGGDLDEQIERILKQLGV